ncbi:MAG: GNAT family N-acetyltransferase [Dehalococcoidia bacterium]
MSGVTVRRARPEDGLAIVELVEALLEYEHIGPMAEGAHDRLISELFAPDSRLAAFAAEIDDRIIGYSIVYETYSTLWGQPRLFIEDIFVLPEYRSQRAVYELFRAVVRYALERGCTQMHWEALTWNKLAIDFYERVGAERDEGWYTYRLREDAMRRLL